jgi:hypothetical protein
LPFLTAPFENNENRLPHGLFACEIAAIMACLNVQLLFREEE